MIKLNKIIRFGLLLISLIFLCNFFIGAESDKDETEGQKEGKKIFVPKDYKTIKEAIEKSNPKDKIYVADGTYDEPEGLRLREGVDIYGTSADKTKVTLGTIGMILGGNNIIENLEFQLVSGHFYLNAADNITLQNCVIVGTGGVNEGLFIEKSENVNIINCTITNLRGGVFIRYPPVGLLIKNSIVSHNRKFGIFVSAEKEGEYFSEVRGVPIEPKKKGGGEIKVELEYNDVWGSFRNYYGLSPGKSDISEDPKFVGEGDYHLQSGSPCIDAGDPDSKYNDPNGTRNDLGALPYSRKK